MKFTQYELLTEGFFETLGNITKATAKAPLKILRATGKAIKTLDPESVSKITKPLTLGKKAVEPFITAGGEIIKDVTGKNVSVSKLITTNIKKQEKEKGRSLISVIKNNNGFIVISSKIGLDPLKSRVRSIYDKNGKFKKIG